MSKLVFITPDYAINSGHVGRGLALFAGILKPNHDEVCFVLPKSAPANRVLDEIGLVRRVLPDSYAPLLVEGFRYTYPGYRTLRAFLRIFPARLRRFSQRNIDALVWFLSETPKAVNRVRQELHEQELSSSDRIVILSADIVFTYALLKVLSEFEVTKAPSVSIRFIGVLEGRRVPLFFDLNRLMRFTSKLVKSGYNISVSTETDVYTAHVRSYFPGTAVAEYPPQSVEPLMHTDSEIVTVGFLGAARPDKGFEILPELIPKIIAALPELNLRFLVQESSKSWGPGYDNALSAISLYPSVELLPGVLSVSEIEGALASSNLIVLPYDLNTYRLRGSAMLFEASDRFIPVIGPSGTAFGETIRQNGLGGTYSTINQIPSVISRVLQLDQKMLNSRISQYNSKRLREVLAWASR